VNPLQEIRKRPKVHNAIEQDTEARCLLIDWFEEKLSNGGKL
jgi:hypothetical protein